ncbi:nitrous oxide-stimulated promoter family protein [Thermoproteota archaeon]
MSVHPRMDRERKTIKAMIDIYCKNHHKNEGKLCLECQELFDYAMIRLDKCPFQEKKTTCGKCPIHCYRPIMRKKVKEVMKHSGPRMIFKHPILALHHVFDGRKKPENLKKR